MILPHTEELLDISHTLAKELLASVTNPHEVLPSIKAFITELIEKLPKDEYYEYADGVYIATDAVISDKATILPPTVIGHRTEVRPGAYIRGSVLIGDDAVIGNSTEIKNSIIFDGVQLPHYNYVGDSLLGYRAHLGAGAVISNFRLDHGDIRVRSGDASHDTGLRKFGAVLGDFVEVGCNSVVCPGTIIGRGTMIYPLTPVRGIVSENSILHNDGRLSVKE